MYKKMSKAIKDKWVKALESGKFKQCRSTLRSFEGKKPTYCCLGVLAKVNGKLGKKNQHDKVSCLVEDSTLNSACSNLFKLDPLALTILVGMNDTDRKTFKQIAAWIKKNI